jgi:hypothetical protein
MRDIDRQRHQRGRLATRVTEHQALIPGPLQIKDIGGLAGSALKGHVDALRNVR